MMSVFIFLLDKIKILLERIFSLTVGLLKILKERIKGLFIYRLCIYLYNSSVHVLASNKRIARFFAHGFIHTLTLLVLGISAYIMGSFIFESNTTSFNQMVYTFYGDTLNNYKLNYISLAKDMTNRKDNVYNDADVTLSYGYELIKDSIERKLVAPYKYLKSNDRCDLVSKIRRVTKNDIQDTIIDKTHYNYLAPSCQYYQTVKKSNHERVYICSSSIRDRTHIFNQLTGGPDQLITKTKLNPFFSFWIGIVTPDHTVLNEKSIIRIKMNDINITNSTEGVTRPLIVEKVIPEPTTLTINEIVYKGKELANVLSQKGIYISGVDPIKKDEVDQKNLKYTVFLGTIIAFMLDIIVQLILKWRKLKDKK